MRKRGFMPKPHLPFSPNLGFFNTTGTATEAPEERSFTDVWSRSSATKTPSFLNSTSNFTATTPPEPHPAVAASASTTSTTVPSTNSSSQFSVALVVQQVNSTNWIGVLKAATLSTDPIGPDWSFSFAYEYPILGSERGNLTGAVSDYQLTSIPLAEPDVQMAVYASIWGSYGNSTSKKHKRDVFGRSEIHFKA